MTLAIILFVSFSCTASNPCLTARQSTAQSASTSDSPAKTQDSAQQGQTPPTSAPAAASPSPPSQTSSPSQGQTTSPSQAPSNPKPSAAKRPHHKKKVVDVNCRIPATDTSSGTSSATSTDAAGTNTAAANAQTTPTNCPPPKKIVRQGGTSEPSIQLEGGTDDEAAYQKNYANQILATTQHNLNQLAGRQLDENQKSMLNQVHDFMQQAKKAVTGGDLDRARTLAWKAQLLSQELIKPEN
jgi:hypothetical protein